jgi:hypothetical protein
MEWSVNRTDRLYHGTDMMVADRTGSGSADRGRQIRLLVKNSACSSYPGTASSAASTVPSILSLLVRLAGEKLLIVGGNLKECV